MELKEMLVLAWDWIRGQFVGFVLGILGTLALAFGSGWISDLYIQKKEKRGEIGFFMGKVTDVVADAAATGYKTKISDKEKTRLVRAAAQLERLGENEMSLNIRRFLNTWMDYWHIYGIPIARKNSEILPDEKIELVKKLDNLTDKILGKKSN